MKFTLSESWSAEMDQQDPLKGFREEFLFPQHDNRKVVYFTGNSLGLQPRGVEQAFREELEDWARWGVDGHFKARHPWYSYHEPLMAPAARIVGAKPEEVVHMNGLTTNLHLLMVSFYRPTTHRYKIICEKKAFPSDQYMLESQAKFHGFNPDEAIVEVSPREGEHTIREEDVLSTIEEHADSLALVFLGGVNYYSGQKFDMDAIAQAGHDAGAVVGFDLAHAAGNVLLSLHDWNVDFAAWCTYKYLNSGPGSVGGVFIHERHHKSKDLPRFAGWWGHKKDDRFKMEPGFEPIPTVEGWQLSNAPVFSMAAHKAALAVFERVSMEDLVKKSQRLTGYLEFAIDQIDEKVSGTDLEVITPRENGQRGCQLSVIAHGAGRELFDKLTAQGVVVDWREPNVIRMAPVPLYNSYGDIFRFALILENALR